MNRGGGANLISDNSVVAVDVTIPGSVVVLIEQEVRERSANLRLVLEFRPGRWRDNERHVSLERVCRGNLSLEIKQLCPGGGASEGDRANTRQLANPKRLASGALTEKNDAIFFNSEHSPKVVADEALNVEAGLRHQLLAVRGVRDQRVRSDANLAEGLVAGRDVRAVIRKPISGSTADSAGQSNVGSQAGEHPDPELIDDGAVA